MNRIHVSYNYRYDVWASDNGFVYQNEPRLSVMKDSVTSTPMRCHVDDGLLYTTKNAVQVPVHRVIAECFLKVPQDFYDNPSKWIVWHKNRDLADNRAENLEFITRSEMRLRCPRTYFSKTVLKCIDPNTAEEKVYGCFNDAAKDGYLRVRILSAINKNTLYKGKEWHIISTASRLRNR